MTQGQGNNSRSRAASPELPAAATRFACHFQAEPGQSIVTAALIVFIGIAGILRLFDQAVQEHSLNRAVQCAWPEIEPSACQPFHLEHDPVPVAFATGEGQHDMEHRWRQRQETLRVGVTPRVPSSSCSIHRGYIHCGYTARLASSGQDLSRKIFSFVWNGGDDIIQVREYLDLVKFSHTLFALPFALLGAVLAAHDRGGGMGESRIGLAF